jgi:hypothetical protein
VSKKKRKKDYTPAYYEGQFVLVRSEGLKLGIVRNRFRPFYDFEVATRIENDYEVSVDAHHIIYSVRILDNEKGKSFIYTYQNDLVVLADSLSTYCYLIGMVENHVKWFWSLHVETQKYLVDLYFKFEPCRNLDEFCGHVTGSDYQEKTHGQFIKQYFLELGGEL